MDGGTSSRRRRVGAKLPSIPPSPPSSMATKMSIRGVSSRVTVDSRCTSTPWNGRLEHPLTSRMTRGFPACRTTYFQLGNQSRRWSDDDLSNHVLQNTDVRKVREAAKEGV